MKKKNRIWFYPLLVMGIVLMLTGSCKKDNDKQEIPSIITDIDDNVYHTVTIGTQVWMVENLKTTKYRNGDPITNITDGAQWCNLETGAYCNFGNNIEIAYTYGKLYNWFTVIDSRKLAPEGWHVPTDAEWKTLTDYLGLSDMAGGKLKEIGTTHWISPNSVADNSSGFTALPGGFRYSDGIFYNLGYNGVWWSASSAIIYGGGRVMYYDNGGVGRFFDSKTCGLSVRCLMD
jgi:uncharacterized protein (TIGR02145 family)